MEGSRPRDPGLATRVGLIGETMEQAREVMVFGESGILSCSPPDRRPTWIAGRQMLVWPNGAEARLYSAFDPERLRGPQLMLFGRMRWVVLRLIRAPMNPTVSLT